MFYKLNSPLFVRKRSHCLGLAARRGQHEAYIALAVLVAIATNEHGVRFGPCVLTAFRACKFGLAGSLRPSLTALGCRLPVQLKAGGFQLGVGPRVGPSGHDVMRDALAGFLASGHAGLGRLPADLLHLGRPLPVMLTAGRRLGVALPPAMRPCMG